jgi:HK97 family phage prohead protease
VSELLIVRALPQETFEPVGDGWTVHGRAVPYGVAQLVRDGVDAEPYLEEFTFGAFARDTAKGARWVNLMLGHRGDDGDRYLGRCIAATERADGLYLDFRLHRDHPHAEEARSGELTGWSVGARVYRSVKTVRDDACVVLRRERCGLNHVAATARPQYAGAGVLVARDHEMVDDTPRTPVRDALLARLGLSLTPSRAATPAS